MTSSARTILPLLLIACMPGGCRCICGDDRQAVARIVSVTPVTEVSSSEQSWAASNVQDTIYLGSALRTGPAGRATVEIFGQGQLRIGPRSLVRFTVLDSATGEENLQVSFEAGTIEATTLDTADAPGMYIDGPGGTRIRIARGSEVDVMIDQAQRLQLDVERGSGEVDHEGERTVVEAGQSRGFSPRAAAGPADAGPAGDAGTAPSSVDAAPVLFDAGDAGTAEGVTFRVGRSVEFEVRAPGAEGFAPPASGRRHTLEPGSSLRVTGDQNLVLTGPGGASVTLHPGAQAVVTGVRGKALHVGLQRGSANAVGTGGGAAALALPGGTAESTPGKRTRFSASVLGPRTSRVAVRNGAAELRSADGPARAGSGEEHILGWESFTPVKRAEVPPVLSGSGVIHDPHRRGSFTVRFQSLPGCELTLFRAELSGRQVQEVLTKQTAVPFTDNEYGEYSWRAACVVKGRPMWGGEVREGRVRRYPDRSSHATMPTKAPRSLLDSDGRTYSVMYQNRLPAITLRWSKAPQAGGYSLEVVESDSGRRIHKGRHGRAVKSFKSGTFREGSYYWFFKAEGTKREISPVTRASILFDNQAPAIQIIEPRDGASGSGSVRVRGVVTVGSSVVVNGVALELGPDYRFDQQVPVGAGHMVLFRVSTPRRGVGYYIRRLAR